MKIDRREEEAEAVNYTKLDTHIIHYQGDSSIHDRGDPVSCVYHVTDPCGVTHRIDRKSVV